MSDEMKELLREIADVLKVVYIPQIKSSLEAEFGNARPEKRLAYDLLQADRSQSKIVEIVKDSITGASISTGSIANWCMAWERLGLARREGGKEKSGSSYVKCFSLRDYDIEVPEVKVKE